MKKLLYLIIYMPLLLLTACDVHEWPDVPEQMPLQMAMFYEKAYIYDTDMTPWKHIYNGSTVIEQGYGEKYEHRREEGTKRYIIRAYPVLEKQRSIKDYVREFVIEKDIEHGYEHELSFELQPGTYDLMVWSDMKPEGQANYYYDAGDFTEITLQGEHQGNCDWRDAFRGTTRISLLPDITEREPMKIEVDMQRPLAKFEFVTTDVVEFIDKELTRITSKGNIGNDTRTDEPLTRTIDIEDYKVVFYYVGFMPHAYSMYADKPVDSSTGVMFESTLQRLSDSEASMGFDYVFVNGKESAVTVQIGIYDNEDTQISLTDPIEVPLKRNHHTILTGMFLMSEASGGVTISPEYDGDHNLIFR